ncbi:hypothetical protein K450DRAFT_257599 [Umbelopsis ramanniana AG]|uniref:Uncharacterized protein n=1 Tax=Umbelopsis ramanniana AG TaxID=1314678 RepID=A0AAD5E2C5_UMBRA|nr:uncharacterized protein K450DRAFT_257599 [Umbelopsis ramanniana AG]KAI8576298.1 hypothetical protein K450DRAFT_257599 [Umbelopsis ramanniana AG]
MHEPVDTSNNLNNLPEQKVDCPPIYFICAMFLYYYPPPFPPPLRKKKRNAVYIFHMFFYCSRTFYVFHSQLLP